VLFFFYLNQTKNYLRESIKMAMNLNLVNNDMGSAVSLLHPTALMNSEPILQSVYFDMENGVALAGFRRQVAGMGVMLVRASYGRHNKVTINDRRFVTNGFYNYAHESFTETNAGLAGTEFSNGEREAVNHEVAHEKIEAVRNLVEMRYEAHLDPRYIHEFLSKNKTYFAKNTKNFENTKINFHFTEGVPKGKVIGIADRGPHGTYMHTTVRTLSGPKHLSFKIDRNSSIPEHRLQLGMAYLFEPVIPQREEGKTVNVVQPYFRGIHMAVQHFNMGLIRPGDRAYSVTPDPTNGITTKSVKLMKFLSSQNGTMIQDAPMLTFDLDMIASLMETLHAYPLVKMKFRDSTSGVYFVAEGNDYMPTIEAIVGPTIQYVRGRIWLP
jgi:hypothetical protein